MSKKNDIFNISELRKQILDDVRVELADEFDRNFQRKGFFGKKWKPRKDKNARGSLLVVTGALRRSVMARTELRGVRFTSNVPYAAMHNEGLSGRKNVRAHKRRTRSGKIAQVKAHTRSFTMPERRFVGNSPEVQRIIRSIIADAASMLDTIIKKHLNNP